MTTYGITRHDGAYFQGYSYGVAYWGVDAAAVFYGLGEALDAAQFIRRYWEVKITIV